MRKRRLNEGKEVSEFDKIWDTILSNYVNERMIRNGLKPKLQKIAKILHSEKECCEFVFGNRF